MSTCDREYGVGHKWRGFAFLLTSPADLCDLGVFGVQQRAWGCLRFNKGLGGGWGSTRGLALEREDHGECYICEPVILCARSFSRSRLCNPKASVSMPTGTGMNCVERKLQVPYEKRDLLLLLTSPANPTSSGTPLCVAVHVQRRVCPPTLTRVCFMQGPHQGHAHGGRTDAVRM